MDLTLKRIIVIVLVQGVLVILLYAGYRRRGGREKTITAESGTTLAADPFAWHPQSWAWPVGIIVVFAAGALLWRPVSTWYLARNPPAREHRSKLLEAASKELHCPVEQLVIEPFGDNGAKVTGCGGSTQLCWGRTNRSGPPGWIGCYLLY
jgi:hypothetical protein